MNNKIEEFNSVLSDLIRDIAYICPKSFLGQNEKFILNFIEMAKIKKRFIEMFMTKILPYKDKINRKDESFFLAKSYSKDININNNESFTGYIFKLKDVWHTLTKENRDVVWQYMGILCDMALEHYIKYHYKQESN